MSPSRGAWWLTLPLLAVTLVMFTAADREAEAVPCRAIDIEVDQLDGMYFVDAPSLRNEVIQQFALLERPMESLPYARLHEAILDHHGVSSCEIVPTLGGSLQIRVQQQRPIARVWTPTACSTSTTKGVGCRCPTATPPRCPSSTPTDRESARDAMPLLRTMDRDAFWNQFIDQVDVDDAGNVRFRPRIGDLVVELGNPPRNSTTASTTSSGTSRPSTAPCSTAVTCANIPRSTSATTDNSWPANDPIPSP